MNILIFSNLFPNSKEPNKAAFNQQQFLALSKLGTCRIVAPIPQFKYSTTEVPLRSQWNGIDVFHPRYTHLPVIGRNFTSELMYAALHRTVSAIIKEYKPDVIYATWAYPDCVVAERIAREHNLPIVCRVHGTDINSLDQFPQRKQKIMSAFKRSKSVIAVTEKLKDKLITIGVPDSKIQILTNGIDTNRFKPMDQSIARQILKLDNHAAIIVYIGNLEPIKGIDLLVDAVKFLDDNIHVYVIGKGSLQKQLSQKIHDSDLSSQLHLIGQVTHADIPVWMNAANALCLPSRNEGCPNVILEALSCHTPVIAANVGGVSELLAQERGCAVVEPEHPELLAKGIMDVLNIKENFIPTRQSMSWEQNAEQVYKALVS